MPRLMLGDGYTHSATTKETVTDARGNVTADGLPPVELRYRPALPEALHEVRYQLRMATSGKAEVAAKASFLCDHLVSWNVTDIGDKVVPITMDWMKLVPEPIMEQMLEIVSKWAPKIQETAANLPSA